VRSESISNENFAERDTTRADDVRFRARLRARLEADYHPHSRLTLGARLSTGDNAYPTSAWSTFSNDFRRTAVQIDRAFINWTAVRSANAQDLLQFRFGIQQNPIFVPTELLWDSDVQPAGASEILTFNSPKITLTAGQFMLREVRSSKPATEENSLLLVHGLTYEATVSSVATLKAGASYHRFTNPNAIARSLQLGELDSDFKTNRFDPTGRMVTGVPFEYFSRFDLLDFGLQVEQESHPWNAAAELAVNLGANHAPALGAAFGAKQNVAASVMIGYGSWTGGLVPGGSIRQNKTTTPWGVRGGFVHIEADSVLAVYNSDDLQQTNVNTVVAEFQRSLASHARLVWDTYVQKKIDVALASNGGIVHPENAAKVRTRISVFVRF
jgi:hypothetical protein